MGPRIVLVGLNELEGPPVHPPAAVGVPVGESERTLFQVVGRQRVVESPRAWSHGVSAQ